MVVRWAVWSGAGWSNIAVCQCPLEPVACEMKEFGCSVVVPRRELATHMRGSELQHLTAMTALNLRLTRQLQQEDQSTAARNR